MRDLVNIHSTTGKMHVSITVLVRPPQSDECASCDGSDTEELVIQREYDINTNKSVTRLCGQKVDLTTLHATLLSRHGLDLTVIHRVVVHQSSTTVANSTPGMVWYGVAWREQRRLS